MYYFCVGETGSTFGRQTDKRLPNNRDVQCTADSALRARIFLATSASFGSHICLVEPVITVYTRSRASVPRVGAEAFSAELC